VDVPLAIEGQFDRSPVTSAALVDDLDRPIGEDWERRAILIGAAAGGERVAAALPGGLATPFVSALESWRATRVAMKQASWLR
jgi:hypothetical protein